MILLQLERKMNHTQLKISKTLTDHPDPSSFMAGKGKQLGVGVEGDLSSYIEMLQMA